MCAQCVSCWGPGKRFGDIPTPNTVFVTVYGIEKGSAWLPGDPEPPNGTYTLTQHVLDFCQFFWQDATWKIIWWAKEIIGSHFSIDLIGEEFAFLSTPPEECRTYFLNDIDDDPPSKFCNGSALTYESWLPALIADEYAIAPVPDLNTEFFELTEDELVLRMRTKYGNDRLFVQFDDSS